jgi:hypothetical protein
MKAEPSKIKARMSQSVSIVGLDLEKKLQSALTCLKQKLNLGYELQVRWVPNGDNRLSGEVKGDCIYIYDEDEVEALETLRHEFLDYAISNIIEPYKQVTNKLIALINEIAYKRKEKLVEALSSLMAKQLACDA